MYGYTENYPDGHTDLHFAETIANSMAPMGMPPTGGLLPASPSQFEAVYMDMGAHVPQEQSPTYPQQAVVGSWEEDLPVTPVKVKEEVSDSGSDWGGTVGSAEESPPKPRRGRLPMNDESLSPYERQKKERRREQNRRAARKCREKRKQHQDGIFQDYYRLKDENNRLREENVRIAAERDRLSRVLRTHEATCTLNVHPQAVTSTPHLPVPLSADPAPQHYCNHSPPMSHSPVTAPNSAASHTQANMDQSLDEIADFVFEKSAPYNSSH